MVDRYTKIVLTMTRGWLTRAFKQYSVGWLLLTAAVAVLTSWATFEVVKRPEITATVRAELDKEQGRIRLASEHDRAERVRVETLRWANPILGAQRSLSTRLDNILNAKGYLALSVDYERLVNPRWSISYTYFMGSSLFLFAQYFAWTEKFKQEMSFELFRSQTQKDKLFEHIVAVQEALSKFPPSDKCDGQDVQVFALQQRAIGELMLAETTRDKSGILTFVSFQDNVGTARFQQRLAPLRDLLESVAPPASECRWKRLKATHSALKGLEDACKELLGTPPDVVTPR